LLLVWIVTLGVVTLHEFAHGITCCHFGGESEIGFMLIYFSRLSIAMSATPGCFHRKEAGCG
jgi:hypothetical protein